MTLRYLVPLLGVLVAAGCASTSTRSLTAKELEVLERMQQRLKENRPALASSLEDLQAVAGKGLGDQHSLTLNIAKAKLLESMRSPWSNPEPDLATTQKEVAFYHLFALHEAERALLDARLEERQAAFDEVGKSYGRLSTLVAKAIEAEKVILAHLNRPARARVGGVLTALLAEVHAFQESLSKSQNPRLAAIAAEVVKAEAKVAKAQDLMTRAMTAAAARGKESHEP